MRNEHRRMFSTMVRCVDTARIWGRRTRHDVFLADPSNGLVKKGEQDVTKTTGATAKKATTDKTSEQRYFRIPFVRPGDQHREATTGGEKKQGWWYAHFDGRIARSSPPRALRNRRLGKWVARQMEVHSESKVTLLVAGLLACSVLIDRYPLLLFRSGRYEHVRTGARRNRSPGQKRCRDTREGLRTRMVETCRSRLRPRTSRAHHVETRRSTLSKSGVTEERVQPPPSFYLSNFYTTANFLCLFFFCTRVRPLVSLFFVGVDSQCIVCRLLQRMARRVLRVVSVSFFRQFDLI